MLRYALPVTLLILFVAYPPICSLAFRAFEQCEEWSDEAQMSLRYLVSTQKNYALPCPSEELDSAQALAWVAICIYPVGSLVLCSALLFSARSSLMYEEHTPFSLALGFMHGAFKPHAFWFDLLEMAKKLLLVGFASLLSPGSLEQIMLAVLVSILFLVLHLQSTPYQNPWNNIVATQAHLLLVLFFLWCTLLQTGALGDPDVSDNTLSGPGSLITVVMMLSTCAVLMVAGGLFLAETMAVQAAIRHEAQKRAKWSVCTLDPTYINWKPSGSYACFLSHYKAEAASDARFLHDVLRKMLRCPVFLDSSALNDLRLLLRDGVADSDLVLVLGTKGVFSRPWCLLEILHATRKRIPIILVPIKDRGFDVDAARAYVANLVIEMARSNPKGLETLRNESRRDMRLRREATLRRQDVQALRPSLAALRSHTSTTSVQNEEDASEDLAELKKAVSSVLEAYATSEKKLSWNPNASDEEVIASLKDIIEQMADVTERKVQWQGTDTGLERGSDRQERGGDRSLAFIASHHEEGLKDARVLQTALAMEAEGGVRISSPGCPVIEASEASQAVLLLLTKSVLHEPWLLHLVWKAAKDAKPIVPILLVGRGYDYDAAEVLLTQLETALPPDKLEELKGLVGNEEAVLDCKATLVSTLPNLIAVNWEPEGGQNMLDAIIRKVIARLPPQEERKKQRRSTIGARSSRPLSTADLDSRQSAKSLFVSGRLTHGLGRASRDRDTCNRT